MKVEAGRVLELKAVVVADVGWERGGTWGGKRTAAPFLNRFVRQAPRMGKGFEIYSRGTSGACIIREIGRAWR